MRNLTVVCFDIRNTLVKIGEDTKEQMKKLVNNLKELNQANKTDGVLVCTATDDSSKELQDIQECMTFFYNLLDEEVFLGVRTYMDGYIENDKFVPCNEMKAMRVKHYVDRLSQQDNIKEVLYFDDSKFHIDVFNRFKPFEKSQALLVTNGLESVNAYFEKRNEIEWTK